MASFLQFALLLLLSAFLIAVINATVETVAIMVINCCHVCCKCPSLAIVVHHFPLLFILVPSWCPVVLSLHERSCRGHCYCHCGGGIAAVQ